MSGSDTSITSTDDVELEVHVATPPATGSAPGLLLLHGFPSGSVPASHIGADLPELADRVAAEMGWVAVAPRFRGCGRSTGDFALERWVDDAAAALAHLRARAQPDRLWVCGFGTGGAVGLVAAAATDDVRGAVVVGTPADFDDWARHPDQLLAHARSAGAIRTTGFPDDLDEWKVQLTAVRASRGAEAFQPRPLLVLHGSDDDVVPPLDARHVADAHGSAELRFISGAGHQLRHDPRAVAILLGWLERRRNS